MDFFAPTESVPSVIAYDAGRGVGKGGLHWSVM